MPKHSCSPVRGISPATPSEVAPEAPAVVPTGAATRIALVAILVGAALVRLRFLAVPLERDEGEYAYMAQLILRGEVPYLSAHNMKLPGTYYAYAAILAALGESDVAIRVGLVVVNLVSIVLLYRLGRTLVGATAGLAAAAAYAALSVGAAVLGFTANAEHFVVLPMLAGVLLLADPGATRSLGRLVAAGLLLGVAVVMKQHGAAFVLFGALWILLSGRRGGRRAVAETTAFAVAALAPFGITCLAMWRAGAFEPFWFWTVTYAREYALLIPLETALPELRRQAALVIGSSVALWTLAALGAVAVVADRRLRRSAAFLGLFTVCSFLAICPGLRFSDHYFILLLPAVSLLAGVAVDAAARATAQRRPGLAPAVAIGLPLVAVFSALVQERDVLLAPSPVAVSRMVYGSNPFPEAIAIARYLDAHAGPDDRVAVIGSEPEIYFYARRRAATSYLYTYPLMEPQPFARRMQEEMIAQLERARPRFLVLVNVDTSWSRRPDSFDLLFGWAERTVDTHYRPVGVAEIVPGQPTAYRWDDAAREAPPRSAAHVMVFERTG